MEEERAELEDHIKELTVENADLKKQNRRRGGGGGGADDSAAVAALREELDESRDKFALMEGQLQQQRENVIEKSSELAVVTQQRDELESDMKKRTARVTALEKELLELKNTVRNKLRSSADSKKKSQDSQKEHLEMYEANDRLKEQNTLYETQLAEEVGRRVELEQVLTSMKEQVDMLEAHKDGSDAAREELQQKINDRDAMLEEFEDQLAQANEAEGIQRTAMDDMKMSSEKQLAAAADELREEKATSAELMEQIAALKDSTSLGGKQREIDRLAGENSKLVVDCNVLSVELEASEKDKEEVMERLLEFEDRFDEKVFERIAQEKEANRTLKLENNNLQVRVKDEQVRINQVERNRDEMSREMEELQNWKAAYEKDHGMQEMARGHKKLKEDNRRQAIAMEQMTTKMGEALDANGVLYQAFDRLKMEAGKSSDFMYDEYELKMDMLGDNAKLQAQVTELEDQVESLEEATIRLRQALKNQAGAVGEQGFKYAGLTADQLVKVNMFATNLRDGSIELPVDDRSAKLLRENHRLREEVDILRTSRVNSDMHSSSSNQGNQGNQQGNQQGTQPMMSKLGESEIFGLREDMQRLMNENSDLKTRMAGMMDELVGTIKASQSMGSRLPDAGEGGGQNSDALAAMVLANNDAMKKELLHELRKSQQMASSLSASMPRHMAPQAITNIHSHHHEAVTPSVAMTPAKQPFTPMVHGSQEAPMTMHHSQQPRFMYTGPMDGATPSLARPTTPHGKKLLSKTLANLNLPPEEWATEVKELNGQLIECLEQLSEREGELDEQKGVIDSLEDNLVTIKQQMAALYHDYSQRVTAWETREKEYKQDNETLRNESDDLRLKVRRLKELSDTVSKESAQTMEQRVLDMGRKLIIYEVNENILTRKYNSVSGQLSQEQEQRHRHEMDIADIEGTLKRRILYLEQRRAAVSRACRANWTCPCHKATTVRRSRSWTPFATIT